MGVAEVGMVLGRGVFCSCVPCLMRSFTGMKAKKGDLMTLAPNPRGSIPSHYTTPAHCVISQARGSIHDNRLPWSQK